MIRSRCIATRIPLPVIGIPIWLKEGWHVAAAYVIGFFVMLALAGWNPNGLKLA
jgi:hypothetical protein